VDEEGRGMNEDTVGSWRSVDADGSLGSDDVEGSWRSVDGDVPKC